MISYDPETPGLSFDQDKIVPPNPNIETDAHKYNYALGEASPGLDSIRQVLTVGGEGNLRNSLVYNKQVEDQKTAMDIVANYKGNGSPEELAVLKTLSIPQVYNPETILEKMYASKLLSDLYEYDPSPVPLIEAANEENTNHSDILFGLAKDGIAKTEYIKKVATQSAQDYAKTSGLGKISDFLETMIPFKSWIDIADDTQLLGSNLKQQVSDLWALPTDEFQPEFKKRYDAIYAHNPLDAQTFLQAVLSYSNSDAMWANMGNLMDVGSFVPVGALSKVGKSAVGALGRGLRGTLEASSRSLGIELPAILSSAGKTMDVAKLENFRRLYLQKVAATDRLTNLSPEIKDLLNSAISIQDPTSFINKAGYKLDREAVERLQQELLKNSNIALDSFDKTNIPRLNEGQLLQAIDEASASIKAQYKHIDDSVADISFGYSRDDVANIDRLVIDLKKPDGTPFTSELAARSYADHVLKLGDTTETVNAGSKTKFTTFGNYEYEMEAPAPWQKGFNAEIAGASTKTYTGVSKKKLPSGTVFPESTQTVFVGENQIDGAVEQLISGKIPEGGKIPVRGLTPIQYFRDKKGFARFSVGNMITDVSGGPGLKRLQRPAYEIVPQGTGFNIRLTKDIDETLPSVKALTIQTKNEVPESFVNGLVGSLRNAADVVHKDIFAARKLAVHGIEGQYAVVQGLQKNISALKGQSKIDFERFTRLIRDLENRDARQQYAQTLADFETEWEKAFDRLPTEQETLAYASYRQAYDWDYLNRNLAVYRGLARQGIRDYRLSTVSGQSPSFHARVVKDLPDDPEANVLFWDKEKSGNDVIPLTAKNKEDLLEAARIRGMSFIQVANPWQRPLMDATGQKGLIHFIATKDFESERLPLQQVLRDPGGHMISDYKFFVKQPKYMWANGKRAYFGDTSLQAATTAKEAQAIADHYEKARELYNAKDIQGFNRYVSTYIGDEKQLMADFETGRLNPEAPISVTGKGVDTISHPTIRNFFGRTFEDTRQNQYNLTRDVFKEYLGERSTSGVPTGVESNPLYRLDTHRYVDPLRTLNRAANSLARNKFLEDFRIKSADHFVESYASVLKRPIEELRQNPVQALLDKNPFNEKVPGKDPTLRNAKLYQKSYQQLIGARGNEVNNFMNRMKDKLFTYLYDRGNEKLALTLDEKYFPYIQDPVQLFKSAAFHLRISMFNPVQYFKQLNTLVNIAGIVGPVKAMKAFPMYPVIRTLIASNESEAAINYAASLSRKFGWKEADFKEMYQAYKRSELNKVEGEHSYRDDLREPTIFQGKIGSLLDKSSIFFREGERGSRIVGFAAAYDEWKKANPYGKLDDRALGTILSRQETLNGSMTRASSATLQSAAGGLASVPLQFQVYPIRIMEQFLSKRLTTAEKLRLFGTYATVYGVPGAIAATPLGLYPWYEDIRKDTIANGGTYPSVVDQALERGIPELLHNVIFGSETDFSTSHGPQGLHVLKDIWSDKGWLDIMLGASGGTMSQVLSTTAPLLKDLGSIVSGDGSLKVTGQDFIDVLRNIGTVNQAFRAYYGVTVSKYINRNQNIVSDVTPWEGIFGAITGVNPQTQTDTYMSIEMLKSAKDAKDYAKQQFIKYIRRGIQSDSDADRMNYFKQANVWWVAGDFQMYEASDLLSQAANGYESMFSSVNQQLILKGLKNGIQP